MKLLNTQRSNDVVAITNFIVNRMSRNHGLSMEEMRRVIEANLETLFALGFIENYGSVAVKKVSAVSGEYIQVDATILLRGEWHSIQFAA